jgi:cytidylate kinase
LRAKIARASSSASGAMTTSVKIWVIASAAARIERAVDRDDAAEGRDAVAGEAPS